MKWVVKKFDSLTASELYELLRLRSMVFHVEQRCAYMDTDNKDQVAIHVMGYEKSGLSAYARILPAGISFSEVSIGRVVTHPEHRGRGRGRELMGRCLGLIGDEFGNVPVRIGAQCYLEKFYKDFGFKTSGNEYLEDDIPHIEMLKPA